MNVLALNGTPILLVNAADGIYEVSSGNLWGGKDSGLKKELDTFRNNEIMFYIF